MYHHNHVPTDYKLLTNFKFDFYSIINIKKCHWSPKLCYIIFTNPIIPRYIPWTWDKSNRLLYFIRPWILRRQQNSYILLLKNWQTPFMLWKGKWVFPSFSWLTAIWKRHLMEICFTWRLWNYGRTMVIWSQYFMKQKFPISTLQILWSKNKSCMRNQRIDTIDKRSCSHNCNRQRNPLIGWIAAVINTLLLCRLA